MPLTNSSTQANIAFKNLLGKSITDVSVDVLGELNGISFNTTSDNIWLNQISSSPTTALSTGYAIKVTASMTLIDGSNNHAYNAFWPTSLPVGTDISTGLTYSYNNGLLTGITAGMVIRNAISDSYNPSYKILVYDSTLTQIVPLDARNWVYQYNSGIFFQETYKSPAPAYASLYVYIGQTLLTQPNSPFTNGSYSEVSLGGLNSRTTFTSTTLNNLFSSILYPSVQSNFTSFTISNGSNIYEVGNGVLAASGPFTMSWVLTNTSSLSSNQVYITSHTGSTIFGPTSNSNIIAGYTFSSSTLTQNTPGTYVWYVSALRSNGERIAYSYSINWYYGLYYGSSTTSGITTSFNSTLQYNNLGNTPFGNYNLPSGGTPSYKYIVVPDTFSALSLITWKGLQVSMADNSDGYGSSSNDLNYKYISYQNAYSITSNYKIYRTKFMLGATMSNVIVS